MDDGEALRQLLDRSTIIDTILRFALAFDTQDWTLLRSCLADVVEVDYSDLRGEPPAAIAAQQYVGARASALSGLRTQHVSTNHLVTVDGDRATCSSCFLIHRVDPSGREGANTFDSAGQYVHRLRRAPSGWLIDGIKQSILWSRGNPEIHGALRRRPPEP